MIIENAILKNIKPIFSGHETFPLRYGWLKKVYDACKKVENENKNINKDLFNNDEAIAILGVGKNMVSSMRYWAIYTGLLNAEENKNLTINPYADKILSDNGFDPWLENYATLWLIHWQLATNPALFTYYFFFNYWNPPSFDKDYLIANIKDAINQVTSITISASTLKRDVECFLNLYSSKLSRSHSNEESIESPLTELGLIGPLTRRDLFQSKRGPKPNLTLNTFIFGLLMFWNSYSPNSKTLSIENICYEPLSPGKIFLIDEDTIGGFLQNISEATNGLLEWSETAGLKQIILKKEINFKEKAYEFFERNYK